MYRAKARYAVGRAIQHSGQKGQSGMKRNAAKQRKRNRPLKCSGADVVKAR